MEALSFIIDGEYFAVDVSFVQTVVRKLPVTPVPTASGEIIGISNFKGRVITVLCLSSFLERPENPPDRHSEELFNTVIFKPLFADEDQLGLAIDKAGDLIKIQDEDIKPYTHSFQPENFTCISSIIEIEGVLYRIINLHAISDSYKSGAASEPQ